MKRTLLLAATAVTLLAAPAYAQLTNTETDGGASWNVPHQSTGSGLPSESPQVQSLENGTNTYTPPTTYSGSSSTSRTGSGSATGGAMDDSHHGTMKRGDHDAMHKNKHHSMNSSGSTGNAAMGTGSTMGRDDIQSRRGRGQNDLELSQTSVLNEFSAQGYTAVRDFRKNGQSYTANAQDSQGRWVSVELDPRSRTITPTR